MSPRFSVNHSGGKRPFDALPLVAGSAALYDLGQALQVVQSGDEAHLCALGEALPSAEAKPIGTLPAVTEAELGDGSFCRDYGVRMAYYAGAMANGIHSEAMAIALGQQKILGIFGAGGLDIPRIAQAIATLRQHLPDGPFGINLLHNPGNPAWEMACVQLCLEHQVTIVEASAYINLSPALVCYRACGLTRGRDGTIARRNRIIAKVSRREVAQCFLRPAPENILKKLLADNLINAEQAELARQVPMADDITVEGDSGGHTDQGTLACIFRSVVQLRDDIERESGHRHRVRIGAAGGIGTPHAVRAAFALGAAYVVTGSINQACVEAGTSDTAKQMLGRVRIGDVAIAPSADMFEMGAKVQVLKQGSMYPVRAQKLYALYKQYEGLAALPADDVAQLEKQIFRQPLANVWQETVAYFQRCGRPEVIEKALQQPKKQMALVFQWYLGQSSRWAIQGEAGREMDYQIWCGSAMGAMNEWLQGTPLEDPAQRHVAELAHLLMSGAAWLTRTALLELMHIALPDTLGRYSPFNLTVGSESQPARQSLSILSSSCKQTENAQNMDASTKLSLDVSKNFYKKCWDLLPGGTHYNFGDPERPLVIPFNRGRNSRVWDLDGNEHLDLFCKFGALFVGHHNEAYNAALMDYMGKVTSVDTCDLEVEVCETLVKHIPSAEMVRFCLSGTEAVQNALRLARGFTGKNRFIRFHGHYHGNADNIMGWRKKQDLSYPVPEQFKGDLLDTWGRATGAIADQSFMLPWNDIEVLTATIERYHDEIAAVLMEPICINGGGIFPREGYLEKAKALCEKYNIVLIFDEIITGVRLGLGGAQQLLGVTPHLSTFGKALGGGSMPISAIVGRRDIMNLYTRGKVIHAGTFNGYPLGLAAIKATFSLIEQDPGCYERMAGFTRQISNIFVKAAESVELPLVVQGMPTALVYHSQNSPVDRSEGYSDKVKFCDIIIREISKRYGIQFSPLSRIYANMLMSQDDVQFFEERIYDAMANARKIIDITFKEGVDA
ncbi:PfaD family polyunsaturated fatty acid/polyketide biosynthesis protein [Serratia plymuthica]|uniref:PfaD family protein n=2 Tax=Serratia plymuthica TaxID=82996 RepID=S4YNK3_SERPL|nr:PfaD family polyunsaturated fatty acid/polyketide biosynthesis protein [Serratia plymuthica]AGP46010.1 PfaD family protein [Serratia plymuthica S13]ANJ94159.1 PfaD family protein [Serratia plymuthica]ANK00425.1 PfaD family protein [Serratia plymuthica]KYG16530.1 Polyketide biosynthesis protein PksE [Serratia plymuthica]MBI6137974.1 PfaD family polyunsaturated fatty acid/polyketide biosynthesis protein [Serratia plymuthica]